MLKLLAIIYGIPIAIVTTQFFTGWGTNRSIDIGATRFGVTWTKNDIRYWTKDLSNEANSVPGLLIHLP